MEGTPDASGRLGDRGRLEFARQGLRLVEELQCPAPAPGRLASVRARSIAIIATSGRDR